MEKKRNRIREHLSWHPLELECRFWLLSRIALSETSFLFEFTIKSVMELVVEPTVTVHAHAWTFPDQKRCRFSCIWIFFWWTWSPDIIVHCLENIRKLFVVPLKDLFAQIWLQSLIGQFCPWRHTGDRFEIYTLHLKLFDLQLSRHLSFVLEIFDYRCVTSKDPLWFWSSCMHRNFVSSRCVKKCHLQTFIEDSWWCGSQEMLAGGSDAEVSSSTNFSIEFLQPFLPILRRPCRASAMSSFLFLFSISVESYSRPHRAGPFVLRLRVVAGPDVESLKQFCEMDVEDVFEPEGPVDSPGTTIGT